MTGDVILVLDFELKSFFKKNQWYKYWCVKSDLIRNEYINIYLFIYKIFGYARKGVWQILQLKISIQ